MLTITVSRWPIICERREELALRRDPGDGRPRACNKRLDRRRAHNLWGREVGMVSKTRVGRHRGSEVEQEGTSRLVSFATGVDASLLYHLTHTIRCTRHAGVQERTVAYSVITPKTSTGGCHVVGQFDACSGHAAICVRPPVSINSSGQGCLIAASLEMWQRTPFDAVVP